MAITPCRRGGFPLSQSPGTQGGLHPPAASLRFSDGVLQDQSGLVIYFLVHSHPPALSKQFLEVRLHSVIKKRIGCLLPKSKREKLRHELGSSFSNKGHGLALADPKWDLQQETRSARTPKNTDLGAEFTDELRAQLTWWETKAGKTDPGPRG